MEGRLDPDAVIRANGAVPISLSGFRARHRGYFRKYITIHSKKYTQGKRTKIPDSSTKMVINPSFCKDCDFNRRQRGFSV